ncbi:MAG TPA: CopG family transcriptional regulator [Tepidiformaceae bacterium]|nr:CopG family transcriptional regulator [Tepidiformaceae bacterium]
MIPYIDNEVPAAVEMKKTSVYLSDEDRERLSRLAERKGKSQAWVLREALLAYDASEPDRNFAIFDAWKDADPNRPKPPKSSDPQVYHDWLMEQMGEGMEGDYERQLREAEGFAG